MIRSGHFWYDLREALASSTVLISLALISFAFIMFLSFQCIYPLALVFVALAVARVLIGRRCPRCDGPLKEMGAEQKKDDAFVMVITWACPRDGYTEKEETKSKIGLFGTR
jgi:hypothetical protein